MERKTLIFPLGCLSIWFIMYMGGLGLDPVIETLIRGGLLWAALLSGVAIGLNHLKNKPKKAVKTPIL